MLPRRPCRIGGGDDFLGGDGGLKRGGALGELGGHRGCQGAAGAVDALGAHGLNLEDLQGGAS